MILIKAIEFPDKEFSSKEELFKMLFDRKDDIISLKKADLKSTDSIKFTPIDKSEETIKGINVPDGFIYAVINTTKYMDSHNDVHLDGIWDKSIKDQQGKVFYVADHSLSVMSVIAFPKNVEMLIQDISWKDLGADFSGKTQALIFKVNKANIKLEQAKEIIEEKIDIDHSVRMQYVKFDLALDSNDDEHKEQKKLWTKTIGLVANKDQAIKKGYFWAVSEARVFKEGSMVLAGSNDITPMLTSDKDIEPEDSTQKDEPLDNTQKELDEFYKNL